MVSDGTAFDRFVCERRIRAFQELPWPVSAATVIQLTDEEPDRLYAARDKDEYWRTLGSAARRIE
jgi:hypothetical protein